MIKNYLLIITKILIISFYLLMINEVLPQEPKIFTRMDFDLTGPVKSCRVITDYGKEDFEFNSDGMLTKSVTRYSDNDYDVSYYKYADNRLVERRDERYQDGIFDPITSMAHFYSYDSVPETRITEKYFHTTRTSRNSTSTSITMKAKLRASYDPMPKA